MHLKYVIFFTLIFYQTTCPLFEKLLTLAAPLGRVHKIEMFISRSISEQTRDSLLQQPFIKYLTWLQNVLMRSSSKALSTSTPNTFTIPAAKLFVDENQQQQPAINALPEEPTNAQGPNVPSIGAEQEQQPAVIVSAEEPANVNGNNEPLHGPSTEERLAVNALLEERANAQGNNASLPRIATGQQPSEEGASVVPQQRASAEQQPIANVLPVDNTVVQADAGSLISVESSTVIQTAENRISPSPQLDANVLSEYEDDAVQPAIVHAQSDLTAVAGQNQNQLATQADQQIEIRATRLANADDPYVPVSTQRARAEIRPLETLREPHRNLLRIINNTHQTLEIKFTSSNDHERLLFNNSYQDKPSAKETIAWPRKHAITVRKLEHGGIMEIHYVHGPERIFVNGSVTDLPRHALAENKHCEITFSKSKLNSITRNDHSYHPVINPDEGIEKRKYEDDLRIPRFMPMGKERFLLTLGFAIDAKPREHEIEEHYKEKVIQWSPQNRGLSREAELYRYNLLEEFRNARAMLIHFIRRGTL